MRTQISSYRRVQTRPAGQGELPPSTGTPADRLGLREYWIAPDRLANTGSPILRNLLARALQALARHEGWQRVRSAQVSRSRGARRATA